MGFQALLPNGEIISPAVEVLAGVLKPEQANAVYRGTTGTCPHCQQMRVQHGATDNWRVQQALSIADLTVRYRSASIDQGRMTRVMHFAHRAGFLSSDGACLLCRSNDLAHHATAVKVIGRWARSQWPGSTVTAEMQVVVPGTPPTLFRPDISITSADGHPIACIEYQRTPEGFQAFTARDAIRLKEFPQVLWFFAQGAYNKSGQHRDYLDNQSRVFHRCWVDGESGRLMHEEGRRRAEKPKEPAQRLLDNCSESSLLRALDRPEQRARHSDDWINGSLDLGISPSFQPSRPRKTAAANLLTVSDRVKAAVAAGMTMPESILIWDRNRHGSALQATEIRRALKRLGAAA